MNLFTEASIRDVRPLVAVCSPGHFDSNGLDPGGACTACPPDSYFEAWEDNAVCVACETARPNSGTGGVVGGDSPDVCGRSSFSCASGFSSHTRVTQFCVSTSSLETVLVLLTVYTALVTVVGEMTAKSWEKFGTVHQLSTKACPFGWVIRDTDVRQFFDGKVLTSEM